MAANKTEGKTTRSLWFAPEEQDVGKHVFISLRGPEIEENIRSESNAQKTLQNGGTLHAVRTSGIPLVAPDDQKLWSVHWIGGLVDTHTHTHSLPQFVLFRNSNCPVNIGGLFCKLENNADIYKK